MGIKLVLLRTPRWDAASIFSLWGNKCEAESRTLDKRDSQRNEKWRSFELVLLELIIKFKIQNLIVVLSLCITTIVLSVSDHLGVIVPYDATSTPPALARQQ